MVPWAISLPRLLDEDPSLGGRDPATAGARRSPRRRRGRCRASSGGRSSPSARASCSRRPPAACSAPRSPSRSRAGSREPAVHDADRVVVVLVGERGEHHAALLDLEPVMPISTAIGARRQSPRRGSRAGTRARTSPRPRANVSSGSSQVIVRERLMRPSRAPREERGRPAAPHAPERHPDRGGDQGGAGHQPPGVVEGAGGSAGEPASSIATSTAMPSTAPTWRRHPSTALPVAKRAAAARRPPRCPRRRS